MRDEELDRSEVEAVLETRRELGSTYDAALVDSFADRIERAVDARVASVRSSAPVHVNREAHAKRQLGLGVVSVVAGIPITALTLVIPGEGEGELSLLSLIVSWGGIVAVNVAHAWQGRPG